MKGWEYLVKGINIWMPDQQVLFNRLGKEGWNLIYANGLTAVFKRPIGWKPDEATDSV